MSATKMSGNKAEDNWNGEQRENNGSKQIRQNWYWDWNGGQASRNAMLLENGFLSDVTLVIGPSKDEIKAHKFILQIGSPVFHQIFEENPKSEKLEIPDVGFSEFKTFLKYLYSGENKIKIEEAQPVLAMSSKFAVDDLARSCAEALKGGLTNNNVLKLFQQAMNFANKALVEACLTYISKNARKLINLEDFSTLTLDCMFEIAQRDDLQICSEEDLFESIIRWGNAECERKHLVPMGLTTSGETNVNKILKKLLPLIRFPLMDETGFVEKVLPKQVLTMEEWSGIMCMQRIPLERRKSLHGIKGTSNFSANPRNYFQPAVLSADRFPKSVNVSTGFQGITQKNEILQFEVSDKVTLVGLKFNSRTFDVPQIGCHTYVDWNLFNVNIVFKEMDKVERVLFKQEVKPFDPRQSLELFFDRTVELEAEKRYNVEIRFSGRLIYSSTVYNESQYNLMQYMACCENACVTVNDKDEQLEEVTFSFIRNSSSFPITYGLIAGLLFKCF